MWTASGWTSTSDDAAGRALRGRALALFVEAADFRSDYPRAVAYAALGAVERLEAEPTQAGARRLVGDAADTLPTRAAADAWPWPEPT